MPPDPLAWHRFFGARSFVSPSKKKILGGAALPISALDTIKTHLTKLPKLDYIFCATVKRGE